MQWLQQIVQKRGSLDRHKCFKEDFSTDAVDVRDAKRKRPEVSRSAVPAKNAPVIQKSKSDVPYKKVANTKFESLEEDPYFYRVKKNIQLCNPDVENGSKKVEVQVSVEGDSQDVIRDMYQCVNCQAILPSLEDISRHLKGHMPTYQYCCKFCPDRWRFTHDTFSGVLKHVRSTHPGQFESLNCVRYGFEASSLTKLEKHLDLKHYPGTTPKTDTTTDEDTTPHADICSKSNNLGISQSNSHGVGICISNPSCAPGAGVVNSYAVSYFSLPQTQERLTMGMSFHKEGECRSIHAKPTSIREEKDIPRLPEI